MSRYTLYAFAIAISIILTGFISYRLRFSTISIALFCLITTIAVAVLIYYMDEIFSKIEVKQKAKQKLLSEIKALNEKIVAINSLIESWSKTDKQKVGIATDRLKEAIDKCNSSEYLETIASIANDCHDVIIAINNLKQSNKAHTTYMDIFDPLSKILVASNGSLVLVPNSGAKAKKKTVIEDSRHFLESMQRVLEIKK